MELVRPIVRFGNSAGVLLPKEWLNGRAKVTLIKKAPKPEKEIFEILKEHLQNIIALAIVGSYARGEQTSKSDVDVLAITHSVNTRIKQGKYEVILISEDALKKQLEGNILPLLPMLIEAKPLINRELLEKYEDIKLTKINLSFHFETTKSAIKVVKNYLEIIEEDGKTTVSDGILYSLILRLREWYIVESLIHGTNERKRDFLILVHKVCDSYKPYEAYVRSKNNEPDLRGTSIASALKLYEFLSKKIREQEQWIRKKG